MIEIGQPTHAFDLDKITGKLSIINSKKELTFLGINNKEYKVNKGTPIIVDDNDIVHALPGVIGSKVSSVGLKNTKNILRKRIFYYQMLLELFHQNIEYKQIHLIDLKAWGRL